MIGGRPFLAPLSTIDKVSKAVDIGCGTGVATVQIATTLPSAQVYGLDISSVPESAQKMAPNNVVWATGNVLDVTEDGAKQNADIEWQGSRRPDIEWSAISKTDSEGSNVAVVRRIFRPNSLDYIFGRMLFLGINDWPRYFATAARSLKSGGLIERQDLDWDFYQVGTSKCMSDKWPWHQTVTSAAQRSGLSVRAGSDAQKLMKLAGLEIVSVQSFEFSFVPSAKTPNSQAMGRYVQAKLIPQYPELLRKMLGEQNVAGPHLEAVVKQCLHDITTEEGLHQKYTVTIARKP